MKLGKKSYLTLNPGTNGLVVTFEPPPIVGQADRFVWIAAMLDVINGARSGAVDSCDSDDEEDEETDGREGEGEGGDDITQLAQQLGEPEANIPISEQLQQVARRSLTTVDSVMQIFLTYNEEDIKELYLRSKPMNTDASWRNNHLTCQESERKYIVYTTEPRSTRVEVNVTSCDCNV
ncbi:hypothetical protein J6590_025673 [Homalodisca vitripennis]|nr:hypothetical protein J6590_025673 [Homalodisca vitripennis]